EAGGMALDDPGAGALRGSLYVANLRGVVPVEPSDALHRKVGRPSCHFCITCYLLRPIRQMKPGLSVGGRRLHARCSRQSLRLVERQRVGDILRVSLCEAGGKRYPILDGLSRALRHERQHGVASVAEECDPTNAALAAARKGPI